MENQLRTLLEQKLELQNQNIPEMSNVQQMLGKLIDLMKERSLKVNDEGSSNLD